MMPLCDCGGRGLDELASPGAALVGVLRDLVRERERERERPEARNDERWSMAHESAPTYECRKRAHHHHRRSPPSPLHFTHSPARLSSRPSTAGRVRIPVLQDYERRPRAEKTAAGRRKVKIPQDELWTAGGGQGVDEHRRFPRRESSASAWAGRRSGKVRVMLPFATAFLTRMRGVRDGLSASS